MRPELALIVEGDCEYDCFPSFIAKIFEGSYFVPISNAEGHGNIVRNIDKLLRPLVKNIQPKNIIITLDTREAIRENLVQNCVELKELIEKNVDDWLNGQAESDLKDSLPNSIRVVIQDKTYDTWLISDLNGLKNSEYIDEAKINEEFDNVDLDIPNPNAWLKNKLKPNVNMKRKGLRKKIGSCINPLVGATKSRSLRKFVKEINLNKPVY